MTRILGLSGKKQAGKNTAANFLLGLELLNLGIVYGQFRFKADGRIEITDLFGDTMQTGIFDPMLPSLEMQEFLDEHVNKFYRIYSFADILKQDICIQILGLTWEQCYGTDEEKNSLTNLKWQNFPGCITDSQQWSLIRDNIKSDNIFYHSPGYMTAREVMQYIGTEQFRKMNYDIWANALLRRIRADNPEFAVITDVRFPNEVAAIKTAEGNIIRFTRCSNTIDEHESEKMLDKNNFDWNNFDAVIDNQKMSIGEQNDALLTVLTNWGWQLKKETA